MQNSILYSRKIANNSKCPDLNLFYCELCTYEHAWHGSPNKHAWEVRGAESNVHDDDDSSRRVGENYLRGEFLKIISAGISIYVGVKTGF